MKSPEAVTFDPFAGPALAATCASTESQREIWTACRLGTEASLAFNESTSLRLAGELDVGALRAAVSDLVARHEALRASFSADGMRLLVAAPGPVEVALLDVSARADADAELAALVEREVTQPFELERGPLFRATLLRRSARDHVLVLTAHHLVCDGYSWGVMLPELGALYSARRAGTAAALPQPDSFSAYSAEVAARATTADHAADERYWTSLHEVPPPDLDLPCDRGRPPLKTYAASRYDHVLSRELVARVRRAGAKHGASLFATLFACFDALLARLTGQDDLAVSIFSAGQVTTGHLRLVGHCVNTLPVRTRVDAEGPFTRLVAATRTALLDAQDHSQFTLGEILRRVPVPRDPSRLPLTSVCFNLDQGLDGSALGFAGLATSLASNPRRYESFDLFVNAFERGGPITLECQFNTDLLEEETVRRWMEILEGLLEAAAEAPETAVCRLPVLTERDRESLAAWNATDAAVPPGTLAGLVAAQARRTPEAVAVVSGDVSLSYAELDRRANRLARRLAALGVGRGGLVGLAVDRTHQMLVALLAVAKTGAGYLPLDPAFPADRLAYMVSHSRVPVLVLEERFRGVVPAEGARVLSLDGDAAAIAAEDDAPLGPVPGSSPEDVAYVLYTSGSTGKPKGVAVPVRAVVNLLASLRLEPGMGPGDSIAAITTLSFDIAVLELWLPLSVGARIVLASKEDASDGALLLELLRTHRPTMLQATPATWRQLVAAGWQGEPPLRALIGGEALAKDLARELTARASEVWNMFGPTETTVWSSCWKVPAGAERILIGKPMANTRFHVLDRHGNVVPIGAVGELYIGGDGVALGYLNRPDLTAERFIPDPFRANGKLYRTGDVARWRPEGAVEYLGRNDHQVKVRGFRIELGEIEAALALHPAVRQAVALAREDRPGDVRLVAYAAPREQAKLEEGALREHLGRLLPQYMVPQHFVTLAAFPLTPNGKVDRKALPRPEVGGAEAEYVGPRTEAERMLAGLFADLLGVPRVHVHDSFFQLGGHSLLASQLVARLAREHGIALPLRKVFEAPSVAGLAALLGGERPAQSIPRQTGDGPWPLSILQERMWNVEQLEPGRQVFNIPTTLRLRGRLDVSALRRAVQEYVRRHDVLRSALRWDGARPVQVVLPVGEVGLPVEDLSHVPSGEVLAAARKLVLEDWARPLDLTAGPLYRVRLFKLDEDDHLLYWLPHHAAWDGWCYDLLMRELDAIYGAFAAGNPSPLPELRLRYADFAVWQRGRLEAPELKREAAWWDERLRGLPELELPVDFPRPTRRSDAGALEHFNLSRDVADALTKLGRTVEATPPMVLLAAFSALLHRWSGQDDIGVAVPFRGRERPELEDLVGYFVNTLVLRTNVAGDPTFRELVRQVRSVFLDAFSHQEVPFEMLALSRTPAYRAFFSYQDTRGRPTRIGDLEMTQISVNPPPIANDIFVGAMEKTTGIGLVFKYSSELFRPETIRRMGEQFTTLVGEALAAPDRPVSQLELVHPDARAAAAKRGVGPALREAPRLVEDALAARCAGTGAPAIVRYGAEELGAWELDRGASALAARLSAAGAGPEAPVAVALDRSPALAIATLAAWRAGAAVVPLDPGEPAPRLAALARAAGARILVARELPPIGLATVSPDGLGRGGGAASPAAPSGPSAAAYLFPAPDGEGGFRAAAVTHGAVAAGLASAREALGLGPSDAVAGIAPPGTARAALELWLPLVAGGTALPAPADATTGEPLVAFLAGSGATAVVAPPSTWRQLVDAGWKANGAFTAVATGEAIAPDLATALLQRASQVVSAYSACECFGFATVARLSPDGSSAGSPAPGVRLALLDRRGRPAVDGLPGEIALGGPALADGVAGGAAFAPERYVGEGDSRLLRTGDEGRWLPDGAIELRGRRDTQVEVRGVRVDLREIEAALAAQPGVRQAAAAARPGPDGEQRIVAYVAAQEGARVATGTLRRALRQAVPEYAVPSVFVTLDSLPLTAEGQVNRKALPDPEKLREQGGYCEPRTDAERRLAGIWREMLEVQRVGRQDNFFNLGGHSLLAAKLVHRIEQQCGWRVGLRALMMETLEQIAAGLPPERRP